MITFTCPACGHIEEIGAQGKETFVNAAPQPVQAPQSNAAPSCPKHGAMFHKKGTSKAGRDYSGWFCGTEGCETKPVWD